MGGKKAEAKWRAVCKRNLWYWHKYGDVRYCIYCKGVLPKTERAPDFAVAVSFTYVECKNNDKTGRWSWKELADGGTRHNQREWLLNEGGWLFIELGLGRAPKGKSAFLVPFGFWVDHIEPQLIELGMASIRKDTRGKDGKRPGADEILARFRLEWVTKEGWIIPNGHDWWKALHSNLIGLVGLYALKVHAKEEIDI